MFIQSIIIFSIFFTHLSTNFPLYSSNKLTVSHYISLPFNLQALNLETNKKVLEAPNGKRRKLGKVNRDASEAVKGDGLGEELDS